MDNYVNFEDFRREQRKREFKEKFKRKADECKKVIMDNKDAIVSLTPVVIGGVVAVTKVIGKHHNLRKEKEVKDLYCYDRKLGHYWALKRELSNNEWLEIDRRKAKGEKLSDILDELKVLK